MLETFFNAPLFLRLLVVVAAGMLSGVWVNWAIYSLAWNSRAISPWFRKRDKKFQTSWLDKLPLIGWWHMRRESAEHGRGFWIRPLLIELGLGVGLALLYWWEVELQGMVFPQLSLLFQSPSAAEWVVVPQWLLHGQFFAHAVLILFMTTASFIDIDEKMIPDAVTVIGTLIGLLLATLIPTLFLPQIDMVPSNAVTISEQHPLPLDSVELLSVPLKRPTGDVIQNQNHTLVSRPVTPAAPRTLPVELRGGSPHWRSLLLGLGCFWLWCFALIDRRWHGRRGFVFAFSLLCKRMWRDLFRLPMLLMLPLGTAAITAVWWFGEAAWWGLVTSLVGMIGSGLVVWGVRLVAAFSLKKEAMGFGDVILMMMVGSFVGWQAGLIIFFIAPFAALVVGIIQLILRAEDTIPYGPFLCMATLVVIRYWGILWNRMQDFFRMGSLIPLSFIVCLTLMGLMLYWWRRFKERFIFPEERS